MVPKVKLRYLLKSLLISGNLDNQRYRSSYAYYVHVVIVFFSEIMYLPIATKRTCAPIFTTVNKFKILSFRRFRKNCKVGLSASSRFSALDRLSRNLIFSFISKNLFY